MQSIEYNAIKKVERILFSASVTVNHNNKDIQSLRKNKQHKSKPTIHTFVYLVRSEKLEIYFSLLLTVNWKMP